MGDEARNEGFFRTQLSDWIAGNLNKGEEWARIFAVTCWWQWYWRNKLLFQEGFVEPRCPDFIIRKYVEEIETSSGKDGPLGRKKKIVEVRWLRPPQGWIKLNFDGAVKGSSGMAGCGGVLRDWKGAMGYKGYKDWDI